MLAALYEQTDIDQGRKNGLTSDERRELVQLCRDKRVLEMEVGILKRAWAFFAREHLPSGQVAPGGRLAQRLVVARS